MDFIERWLQISPDGGNGVSELLIVTAIVVTIVSVVVALRHYLPKNFIEFLEQLGKRENSDRFDN
jgi:hypothetical protein